MLRVLQIVVVVLALCESAAARALKLVALGDSLTAGYGLGPGEAFPDVLQAALRANGMDVTIENAGVSGDTASGGAERVDWSVPDDADGVLLELGANDALRGQDPAVTEQALDKILVRLAERKIPVLLLGMRAPRNLGPDYGARFDRIYPALAERHGVMLYPFFLDGVAGDGGLNQRDGIHPNTAGVRLIAEQLLPTVQRFVKALGDS